MKIALVQMEIKERNCAGNTEHGLKLLEKAAEQKTAKETQMYRTVFWTLWDRVRVG